jgi:CHAT domain-containing protein
VLRIDPTPALMPTDLPWLRGRVTRFLQSLLLAAVIASPAELGAQSPLAPGATHDGSMQPGERQRLVIALDRDACARLELRTEMAVAVTVRDPDGTTTTLLDDASREIVPQPVTLVARSKGDHVIELHLPEPEKSGSYLLTLLSVQPAVDADRQAQRAESLFREGLRLFTQTARESRLAAVEKYQAAASIFRTLGDQPMEAKSIDKRGQSYNRLGESRLALQAYEQSLALFRALGDRGEEASALNNVALERVNLGQFAEAIEPLKTAAAIFHEIGDAWTERSPINNLGLAYYRLGEIELSTQYYRRAAALAQANGDPSGEAYAHVGLGGLALLKGNLQEALDLMTRAYELWHGLGNHQMAALALGNVGSTHLYLGDPQAALDYLTRAQEMRKVAPNRINEAATLGSMASAYRLLGEPRKALEIVRAAIAMWRELGIRTQEADGMEAMAAIHVRLGELDAAAAAYDAARQIAHESGSRIGEAFALSGLSRVRLAQNAPAEAASLASKALSIAQQGTNLRFAEEEALVALGHAEFAVEALDASRDHAAKAIEVAESIRSSVAGPAQRSSYLGHNHDAYGLLVDVLMRLHRRRPGEGFDRQAFEASERGRARTFVDLLGESRGNIREGIDPALVAREQDLRAALAALRGESDERVNRLLVEYRDVQNDIRVRSPRYASLVEPQSSGLDDVQRDLDADTVLLEYTLGDERSYVWVAGHDSLSGHELPSRARIEALARRVYDALGQPQAPELRDAMAELSRAVVEPVAARIAGKRLAIVTEGTLQYIPFAALVDGGGRPLIDSHEIVSLPSASTLRALRRDAPSPRVTSRSVFVVADPVFDTHDPRVKGGAAQPRRTSTDALERSARDSGVAGLERLWFTRREADVIASLVPGDGGRKLLDFDASLERVSGADLTSYGIVHFATHGLLNNKHPELSGLVFSLVDERGHQRDGFLPAYEVYNLRLNADLVVLSACQTALGEDVRGEGLVGLTRAFMYAGTSRVVASLWRVPDSATAAPMERFYRALLIERRTPAAALRQAQQSVRAERRWAAPYYWAGFTLVGEWK